MGIKTITSAVVAYLGFTELDTTSLGLNKMAPTTGHDKFICPTESKLYSSAAQSLYTQPKLDCSLRKRLVPGLTRQGTTSHETCASREDCWSNNEGLGVEDELHIDPSKNCEAASAADSGLTDWLRPEWLYEEENFITEPPIEEKKHHDENPPPCTLVTSCHHVADSLFSTSSGFNDYRGLLNLCIILLVLANTRAALENLIKYGILIDPVLWLTAVLREPYSWPSFTIVLCCNIFILVSFFVEKLLAAGSISEKLGNVINGVNIFLEITLPALVVLWTHPSPLFSSVALAICTVVFLKLISYTRVNAWCRLNLREPRMKRNRTKSVGENLHKMGNGHTDTLLQYPDNIMLHDIYYFMLAPALCYELNFPRSGRIRKRFLIKRALEMGFLLGLMISLIQQWIIPTVNNSMVPFHELHVITIVARLLKLAVPNHLIWLIFFYWFFHSCLNVVAELMRFGDRVFYRDWWNAETVQYFWQNWNIPVHKWASRHLYKPMLSVGYSKLQASLAVFLASALFHEYLVSVPLRMFRLWSFSAMLGQLPLAYVTSRYLNGQMGNMAVWMSIIIGQPVAILMYYHDYYIIHYQ